jgi:hypothetical protein
MILVYQRWCVYLVSWLPSIVSVWISLPLKEVLQGLLTSVITVLDNGFHFILRFPLFYVRRRPRVVYAFLFRLLIWS